jgi:hypothetical protein
LSHLYGYDYENMSTSLSLCLLRGKILAIRTCGRGLVLRIENLMDRLGSLLGMHPP